MNHMSETKLDTILQSLDQQSHTTVDKYSKHKMSKTSFIDMMSRRDIFLHKKLKDQQVLQLHTRLHYLDQENKKKERQIEEARKRAELQFENQM